MGSDQDPTQDQAQSTAQFVLTTKDKDELLLALENAVCGPDDCTVVVTQKNAMRVSIAATDATLAKSKEGKSKGKSK